MHQLTDVILSQVTVTKIIVVENNADRVATVTHKKHGRLSNTLAEEEEDEEEGGGGGGER